MIDTGMVTTPEPAPAAPLLGELRRAIFSAVLRYHGGDEGDDYDQQAATELTDALCDDVAALVAEKERAAYARGRDAVNAPSTETREQP